MLPLVPCDQIETCPAADYRVISLLLHVNCIIPTLPEHAAQYGCEFGKIPERQTVAGTDHFNQASEIFRIVLAPSVNPDDVAIHHFPLAVSCYELVFCC
jgi:hypothetical protein